jgi:hypothetical protein
MPTKEGTTEMSSADTTAAAPGAATTEGSVEQAQAAVPYSFCIIETSNNGLRGRVVQLIAKLLQAGFALQNTTNYTVMVPISHAPSQAAPAPIQKHMSIYTLVRVAKEGRGFGADHEQIDAAIATAKTDVQQGQLDIQIA